MGARWWIPGTAAATAAVLGACAVPAPVEVEGDRLARDILREAVPQLEARTDLSIRQGVAALESADALPVRSTELRIELLSWLGHGYALEGRYEESAGALGRALALDPKDAWLRYAIGVAHTSLGEYESALPYFDAALERDASNVHAWIWRANSLRETARAERALCDLGAALELIENADAGTLALWGGDRQALVEACLRARVETLRTLGRTDEEKRDRAQLRELRPIRAR